MASKSVSLLGRTQGQCLWILGDPKDQICCGDAAINKIYCEKHYRLAYPNAKKNIKITPYMPIPTVFKI